MTALEVRALELSAAMEAAAERFTVHSATAFEAGDLQEGGEYVGRADELRKAAAAVRRIVAEHRPSHAVSVERSTHPTRGHIATCTCGWTGPARYLVDVAGRDGDNHLRWAGVSQGVQR